MEQRFSKSYRISDDTNVVSSDGYTAILRNDLRSLKEALSDNRYGCLSYIGKDIFKDSELRLILLLLLLLDATSKMTAFALASSLGQEEYVSVLIDAGVDIDEKDHEGNAAIHIACSNGHKNILNCLVFHNADVTAVNNKNCNALHVAAYNG